MCAQMKTDTDLCIFSKCYESLSSIKNFSVNTESDGFVYYERAN